MRDESQIKTDEDSLLSAKPAEPSKDQAIASPADENESSDTSQPSEDASSSSELEPPKRADVKIIVETPLYNRNELNPETWGKLNELERKAYAQMTNSEWYLKLPTPVQEVVKRVPPFNLYKLKSMGHVCSIVEYFQLKDEHEAPVLMEVLISSEYNKGNLAFYDETGTRLVAERKIWGCPESDLVSIGMRSVWDMQKFLESQPGLPIGMQILNTRKGQLERSKRQAEQRRKDN